MKVLGIPLRKPSFGEVTAAAILAVGLWILAIALLRVLHVAIGAADAGALLLVMAGACVSARAGIRVDHGHRHLLANLLISALLLGVYQGAWAIAA